MGYVQAVHRYQTRTLNETTGNYGTFLLTFPIDINLVFNILEIELCTNETFTFSDKSNP